MLTALVPLHKDLILKWPPRRSRTTLPHLQGRGDVGFANPGIGNHGAVGKVVQFLQKYLTCYNSHAHGYEWSRSFKISGYYGWWMAGN